MNAPPNVERAAPAGSGSLKKDRLGGAITQSDKPKPPHTQARRYSSPPEGWSRDASLISELERIKERLAMQRPGAREECVRHFLQHWKQATVDLIEVAGAGLLTRATLDDIEKQITALRAAYAVLDEWRPAAWAK